MTGQPPGDHDDALRAIANAPTARAALDACRDAWDTVHGSVGDELAPPEWLIVRPGATYLRFVTGGWYDNEEAMDVLRRHVAWFQCWRLSAAGGLYVFEYPAEGEE